MEKMMHHGSCFCKGAVKAAPVVNLDAVVTTAAELQKVMANHINHDGSLKPETIRALLKLKSVNLKVLAETNGFVDPWIHQIINREYPDPRVRKLLAETIGISDR